MELEDRMKCLEDQVKSMEDKLDSIMEQVTLGKNLVTFAKMAGWLIGVLAATAEVYRSFKGS